MNHGCPCLRLFPFSLISLWVVSQPFRLGSLGWAKAAVYNIYYVFLMCIPDLYPLEARSTSIPMPPTTFGTTKNCLPNLERVLWGPGGRAHLPLCPLPPSHNEPLLWDVVASAYQLRIVVVERETMFLFLKSVLY